MFFEHPAKRAYARLMIGCGGQCCASGPSGKQIKESPETAKNFRVGLLRALAPALADRIAARLARFSKDRPTFQNVICLLLLRNASLFILSRIGSVVLSYKNVIRPRQTIQACPIINPCGAMGYAFALEI
jgi:hypothetical protein